jgi:hypothetical protein
MTERGSAASGRLSRLWSLLSGLVLVLLIAVMVLGRSQLGRSDAAVDGDEGASRRLQCFTNRRVNTHFHRALSLSDRQDGAKADKTQSARKAARLLKYYDEIRTESDGQVVARVKGRTIAVFEFDAASAVEDMTECWDD